MRPASAMPASLRIPPSRRRFHGSHATSRWLRPVRVSGRVAACRPTLPPPARESSRRAIGSRRRATNPSQLRPPSVRRSGSSGPARGPASRSGRRSAARCGRRSSSRRSRRLAAQARPATPARTRRTHPERAGRDNWKRAVRDVHRQPGVNRSHPAARRDRRGFGGARALSRGPVTTTSTGPLAMRSAARRFARATSLGSRKFAPSARIPAR